MIQPFSALVIAEVVLILTLLFRTPLRKPTVMMVDKMKQGRGPVVAKTVAGTLFMIFISTLNNIMKIQNRAVEAGTINPTDQILLVNQILEAILLGKQKLSCLLMNSHELTLLCLVHKFINLHAYANIYCPTYM